MFVGGNAGESLYLINCALLQFGIVFEGLHGDYFDCIVIPVLGGVVNLPVDPLPNLLVQSIVLNYAAHTYILYINLTPLVLLLSGTLTSTDSSS